MQVEIVQRSENAPRPSTFRGARIQLKTILVPTDFSPVSAKALRYAVALAMQFDAKLSLLHALNPSPSYTGMETIPIGLDDKQMTANAEKRLQEFSAKHVPADVPITSLVRHGSTEREIANFAKENNIDLVVASTHKHPRVSRALFGGVTEHIVHRAPCPILIVREDEHEFVDSAMIRIERILAPVDFSETSRKALRYAVAIASQFNARILCLHVQEPEYPKILFETESYERSQREVAEGKLEALVREVDGAVPLESRLVTAVPERAIVELAREGEMDLIILGEHCRTGIFGRFMLGSTTDEVVKHAHCPILVVRPVEREFVE